MKQTLLRAGGGWLVSLGVARGTLTARDERLGGSGLRAV
jgi:hypothetical protein